MFFLSVPCASITQHGIARREVVAQWAKMNMPLSLYFRFWLTSLLRLLSLMVKAAEGREGGGVCAAATKRVEYVEVDSADLRFQVSGVC